MCDRGTPPLPDVGQWLGLALSKKLPPALFDILRAPIIGLHHFLMLFIMLGLSVLFDTVKASSLGLAARYNFTVAIGRRLQAFTFASTILPSVRPWCTNAISGLDSFRMGNSRSLGVARIFRWWIGCRRVLIETVEGNTHAYGFLVKIDVLGIVGDGLNYGNSNSVGGIGISTLIG